MSGVIGNVAAKGRILINKGETFDHTLDYEDDQDLAIDLTGYTARLTIRDKFSLNNTNGNLLIELTTENGGIVLGGALGTIQLLIDAPTTTALTWSTGYFTLELIDASSNVERLLTGSVSVIPEIPQV